MFVSKIGKGSFTEPFALLWFLHSEVVMSVNVKLPESLVDQAKSHAQAQHRSVPKQIEHWSRIGKIAEENPDLPFFMIRDILIADQEPVIGEYSFS